PPPWTQKASCTSLNYFGIVSPTKPPPSVCNRLRSILHVSPMETARCTIRRTCCSVSEKADLECLKSRITLATTTLCSNVRLARNLESSDHHPSRILVFHPIFHREPQQRQTVRRSRSRSTENPPHVLVDVRKTQPHQQMVVQHLAHAKAGEQSPIIEIAHDLVPRVEVMNYFRFITTEGFRRAV